MKEKIKGFLKLSEEDILIIVLALTSFSIGIWTNYRQLWLEDVGFNITQISRIFSAGLICSAVIAFIISIFSSKIKIKGVIFESILIRIIAMGLLLFVRNEFAIKICILLCFMCEVIFYIAYYPLLSTINKSGSTYRKKR